MYLFDTNIFLEILLGQNNSGVCQSALARLNSDRQGWVTSFSLHAIEAIIGGGKKSKILRTFLEFIDEAPHLYLYTTSLKEEIAVSALLSTLRLDYDDTLQYYVAKKKGLTLVTLNHDFDIIKDIPVSSPQSLI